MADRFFTPDPLGPGEHELAGAEAHHVTSVRRFAPGDALTLFNGDGREYPARVMAVGKRTVALQIGEGVVVDREVGFPLIVAAAVPKGDRADYLIEKLTELGATAFVPLLTERSQPVKESKAEKFERAVIEASKQCGRNVLMRVWPPTPWAALLASDNLPATRVLLHTGNEGPLPSAAGGVVVAVGPEGGFTDAEVSAGEAAGWVRASLGPRVLRVETAATAAVAILASRAA